jgi:uncharacterized FlgJ-related protein
MYDQLIYDVARRSGFPDNFARLLVAQCKHESANYSSPVFKANNNLNGYKFVGQKIAKKGTLSPEGDYYAKYAKVEDSAKELVNWIKRRQMEKKFPADLTTINSPGKYAELLKASNYYGDSVKVYTNGLIRWLKKVNVSAVAIGLMPILIIIGLILYNR